MKIKKILSLALSGAMAVSIFGSLSANAEEIKKYKLSELLAMNKEEFFSLDGAESYYNHFEYQLYTQFDWIKCDDADKECLKYLGFTSNMFSISVRQCDSSDPREYNPGITEKEIDELLDAEIFDNLKLKVTKSPIMLDEDDKNDPYYFLIKDRISIGTYGSGEYKKPSDITDEEWILRHAKADYCIDQIKSCSFDFYMVPESISKVAYGDANGDGKVNIRDAAHIAIKLASGKANELTELADANGDEKINIRDGAFIARLMAARKVYKTN